MVKEFLQFDRSNKQFDYSYTGRSLLTNEFVVGYVAIEKQWCSNPDDWRYFIFQNKYIPGDLCGSLQHIGLEPISVDPKTIEPYNQITHIKHNQSLGIVSILLEDLKDENSVIAFIGLEDEIPLDLWR